MVKKDSKRFTKSWRQWAADVKTKSSEWKTTEVTHKNKVSKKFEEEAISPGSVVKLALKGDFRRVKIYVYRPGKSFSRKVFKIWQRRLCQVLVNICKDSGTLVNKDAIRRTSNGLSYLQLEVKTKGVQKVLKNKELGFAVVILSNRDEKVIKHYAIDIKPNRKGRSLVERDLSE